MIVRTGLLLGSLCLFASVAVQSQAQETAKKDAAEEVLAVVNGESLTRSHFQEFIGQYSPQVRAMAESQKGRFMRELVVQILLAQEGRRIEIDKDPEVQSRLRMEMANTIARAVVRKSVEDDGDITDAKIQAHYDANKNDFVEGETVTASHILVETETEAKALLGRTQRRQGFCGSWLKKNRPDQAHRRVVA